MTSILKNHSILLVLVALAACGGGGGSGGGGGGSGGGSGSNNTPIDPNTVAFTSRYFPAGKAAVSYPQTWRLEIFAGDPEVIALMAEPPTSGNDDFEENVALVKVAGNNLRDSSGATNIQVRSTQNVDIAGLAGQEVIFDGDVPGVNLNFRFMEISYSNGDETYGLFYTAERNQFDRNRDIVRAMAERLNAGRIVIDGLVLGSFLETPGNSPIATDGNNFLVVSCREIGNDPTPIIARLVGPDRSLPGDEIVVEPDININAGCRVGRPRVTFDGVNFLVTYVAIANDRFSILGRRVSPSGQVLDSIPINISQNFVDSALEPASVFTGTRHLVLWHQDVSNSIDDVVRGAFVDPDGSVSNTFIVFDELRALYPDQFGNFTSRTELAVGNNRVMAVLAPRFARDDRQPDRPVYAQLLDLDGNVQLPSPLLIREDNGDNPRYAQVASDGQSFFVAWIEGLLDDGSISSGVFGVYGREVSATGQLINGDATTTGLEIAAAVSDRPREDLNLTYDNGRFYLLWAQSSLGAELGIFGTEVEAVTFAVDPERAISPTESQTYNNQMPQLSHPVLGHSPTQKLVVWPSRDGTVDAWLLN